MSKSIANVWKGDNLFSLNLQSGYYGYVPENKVVLEKSFDTPEGRSLQLIDIDPIVQDLIVSLYYSLGEKNGPKP